MRKHRVAVTTALLVCAGTVSVPATAQADSTNTFYVSNAATASCSDSTTDSSTTPYCTIQAAVNAATSPGDTVVVALGVYAPFSVKASGTAAAPITVKGVSNPLLTNTLSYAGIRATTAENEPAVSIDGASYVDIDDLYLNDAANQSPLAISGSSHITVDSSALWDAYDAPTMSSVPIAAIAGSSNAVTLSRDVFRGYSTAGAVVAVGGSDDTVTDSEVIGPFAGPGIVMNQVTGAAVTGNTLESSCGDAIDIADGSTSASIENNVVPDLQYGNTDVCSAAAESAGAALAVDAASIPGTTADYNTFATGTSYLPDLYLWAGEDYTSAAAFTTGTGQGTHDSAQPTDSANADAPGELATDMKGEPRVDDPDVADTGVGTYSYYDRGASESEDPVDFAPAANWPSKAPVGGTGAYSATLTSKWGSTVTGCTYDFGDGTAAVSVAPDSGGTCTTQHTYTASGIHTVAFTAAFSDGYTYINHAHLVTVDAATPLTPALQILPTSSLGVQTSATESTDGWSLASCTFDFGDGTAPVTTGNCMENHSYASPGTRTVKVSITDAGGNQATTTSTYTTSGSFYTPITPKRVLDTRNGTGTTKSGPVAADGTVKLKLAGVDGLPTSGVTAVALNITATEATKIGVIAAYPDGGTLPNVSNVDFKANQNVANTVIVEVGSDGSVDLANRSAGTTDIVADLEGYYAIGASSGYTPVDQVRVLDTRKTKVPVAAGQTVKLSTSAYPGISAAVMNLTVVDATGNGYVRAYPDGGAVPTTSNVNYLAGQTVANEAVVAVGSDGDIDFTNYGKGQADLIVDLSGYFTPGSGEAFTPVTPERYLDTRSGLGDLTNQNGEDVLVAGTCPLLGNTCAGANEVPAGALAVAANVTVAQPTANGYLTAFPGDETSVPTASLLNFLAGQQTQNALTVGLGPRLGDFQLHNASTGSTQMIVDVFGYYED